jgi:hypothetical protein
MLRLNQSNYILLAQIANDVSLDVDKEKLGTTNSYNYHSYFITLIDSGLSIALKKSCFHNCINFPFNKFI